MKAERLLEIMEEVESEREYDGYYYSLLMVDGKYEKYTK